MGGVQVASADDAEWGCQVLLCAASQSPSWHGVPYCVPPMTKLIAAMKLPGFTWPICPGAGTGAPGFQQYDDCPTGYSIAEDESGHGGSTQTSCVKYADGSGGHGNNRVEVDRIPRPMKQAPYYFDISGSDGAKSRFWFDLHL
ncbi:MULTISPECIES: hypothetical protein [Rhizobium]